jgi:hypothetical protein
VLLVFAVISAFFLLAEHRAHILPWLPWLLLAACPVMHMFMRHGHAGHDHRSGKGGSDAGPDAASGPGSHGPDRTSVHPRGDGA